MNGTIIVALVQDTGLLLAMVVVFDLVRGQEPGAWTRARQVAAGFAMGTVGIAMIATSIWLAPGVIFDTRSVLLAVTGLFLGPLPAAVTIAMTAAYRLAIGGPGALIGIGVILSSGLIGILWRRLRHGMLERIPVSDLYGLGLVVHVVMLALLWLLPGALGPRIVGQVWLPVLLVHPLATVVLGMLFARRLREWRLARELRASEERFRLLAENATDLVYRFEFFPTPGFGYVSPSATSLIGYTPDEFYADPQLLLKIAHPDDRPALESAIRDASTSNQPLVLRWIHKDGRVVWSERSSTPILDPSGRLIAFEGIARDITESHEALAALREREALLRMALEASNQATYDLHVESGVTAVSEEYARMLGEDPRALTATRNEWFSRIHPDDQHEVIAARDAYLSGASPDYRVEARRRHRNGSWIWTLSHGTVVQNDADGRPIRMIGTIQDITALKQAELNARNAQAESDKLLNEARRARRSLLSIMEDQQQARAELLQARQFAQSTLDALKDHICVIDETGCIVAVNGAWRAFAANNGVPDGEAFVGENYLTVCENTLGPEKAQARQVADQLRSVIDGRLDAPAVEYPCHSPSEQRWFNVQMTRFDVAGHARVVVAHENITARKRTEEERLELTKQLLHSQKLESLGSLAGGIAHDINNVLAAVSNAASTHRRQLDDSDPIARSLDTIMHACVRGRSVVQSLLYFARQGTGSPSPVDLNVIAREIVTLLGQTTLKRINLMTDLEEPLDPINGDAAALNHAVMNLCLNSADAMKGGGEITIRTRRRPDATVEISVRDNGPGMSPAVRERAIEPFFTTKPVGQGSGLGLAMVYGTTQAHGGTCEIRSELGRGTEVVLSFPSVTAQISPPDPVPEPGTDAGQAGRLQILLVDDDDLILESFPPLLEAMGHDVEAVSSGAAAIARLEAGLAPDVVILDMNMPGMTGAETLPRILEIRPEQRVLISTGFSDTNLSGLANGNPGIRSLRKPFTVAELQEALSALSARKE